jgi:hypothetical protein
VNKAGDMEDNMMALLLKITKIFLESWIVPYGISRVPPLFLKHWDNYVTIEDIDFSKWAFWVQVHGLHFEMM